MGFTDQSVKDGFSTQAHVDVNVQVGLVSRPRSRYGPELKAPDHLLKMKIWSPSK